MPEPMPGEPPPPALRERAATLLRSEIARHVALPFLLQRSLLFLVVAFAGEIVPRNRGWHALPNVPLLDDWLRWDSAYYLTIAEGGYSITRWGNLAPFFPLYPGATAAVGLVLPTPLAALLVSNAAAFVACLLLYAWVKSVADERTAARAVWLMLLFPASFFLSAAYSESVYLVAALGTFIAWRRGRPGWAALGVFAATLARPVGGICVTLPFAIGWLMREEKRRVPWFIFAALPAGIAVLLIHHVSTGDWLALFHSTKALPFLGRDRVMFAAPGEELVPPAWWEVLWDEGLGKSLMLRLYNWLSLALAAAAGLHLFRRREWELGLLVVLTLAVPLSFHGLFDAASMGRYALTAFPIFLVLARWAPAGTRARGLEVGFVMLQAVLATAFATWHWAE